MFTQQGTSFCSCPPLMLRSSGHLTFNLLLVITKGYRVQATMIEGQDAFAPLLCFAYVCTWQIVKTREIWLWVIESPNRHDQIALCPSGSPNECWLHTCDATWRVGLRLLLLPAITFWIFKHSHIFMVEGRPLVIFNTQSTAWHNFGRQVQFESLIRLQNRLPFVSCK